MTAIPAAQRNAAYRLRQSSKATAQAKRVEELEGALRRIAAFDLVNASSAAHHMHEIAAKALGGSAKA